MPHGAPSAIRHVHQSHQPAPAPPELAQARACATRCPVRHPAGGPKPPASARPAHGGRFSPAGAGAGLCHASDNRSCFNVAPRAGKRRSRFLFRPKPPPSKPRHPLSSPRKRGSPAGQSAQTIPAFARMTPRPVWQRRVPLPCAAGSAIRPCAQSTRPAPARVGRWPLSCLGQPVLLQCGTTGGETQIAFPFPPEATADKAPSPPVIPAQAGISRRTKRPNDPRLGGDDTLR